MRRLSATTARPTLAPMPAVAAGERPLSSEEEDSVLLPPSPVSWEDGIDSVEDDSLGRGVLGLEPSYVASQSASCNTYIRTLGEHILR
jgi:hypothetical protein